MAPDELRRRLSIRFSRETADSAPEALANISSAHPLHGHGPLGGLKVAVQRVVRRSLAWYVHPITEDQSRFNDAITTELRRLERRVHGAEAFWPPLARDVPMNTGVDEGRASLLAALGSSGDVLSIGAGDPGAVLRERAPASLDGVYLAGVLPRLAPREMLEVVELAADRVRPGGWLAADAPDPAHPATPRDPSGVELGMRRWLDPDTLAFLLESAGLSQPRVADVVVDGSARSWFAVVARRSR